MSVQRNSVLHIAPNVFYKTADKLSRNFVPSELMLLPGHDTKFPRSLMSILDGPSETWKVFHKQNDALSFSRQHGGGLMTFAFQQSNGSRLFLSAHPVYFWFYDSQCKKPEDRRTFEIISENTVCKLYLDLEFDKECNKYHDGVRMTNTFIKILSTLLCEEFGIACDRRCIIDLDSTTDTKFSRHLIFQLPRTVFRNNYNVGNFVKMVCEKLRMLSCAPVELCEFCRKCNVADRDVKELFVKDKKNKVKIFCDEGVYTKNRHFRLYKSTKWNKNAPLTISLENEYQPIVSVKDQVLPEKQFFLDSLVTFFPDLLDQEVTILEYGLENTKLYTVTSTRDLPDCPVVSEVGENSPEPAIDDFIQQYVSPGHIRRSTYFASINRIVYDIAGNRFCHNIGRAHKSNNVLYVVDLALRTFYQKCHDPDCSGYRSQEMNLPPELLFLLENEGDACFENVSQLSYRELQQIWEAVEAAGLSEENPKEDILHEQDKTESFPEFGLSDTELLNSSVV